MEKWRDKGSVSDDTDDIHDDISADINDVRVGEES